MSHRESGDCLSYQTLRRPSSEAVPLNLDSDATQDRKACCVDMCGLASVRTNSQHHKQKRGQGSDEPRSVENRDPIASRRHHVREVGRQAGACSPVRRGIAFCDGRHDAWDLVVMAIWQPPSPTGGARSTVSCASPRLPGSHRSSHAKNTRRVCSISRACETDVNLVSMEIAHHPQRHPPRLRDQTPRSFGLHAQTPRLVVRSRH